MAALIHNLPVIRPLVAVHALNGEPLPVILFIIMRLINVAASIRSPRLLILISVMDERFYITMPVMLAGGARL